MGKRSRNELAPEYVERDPEACHRSLAAERIASEFGLPLDHIRP